MIYGWFGGMKFTAYEAEGLTGLVGNSPLLSWTYSIFSVRDFSSLLGLLELSIGALIAARLVNPVYSLVGGLLSAGLFRKPRSRFMGDGPGSVRAELVFQRFRSLRPFLLKDIGLLALSLWIASTRSRRSAQPGHDDENDGGAPPPPAFLIALNETPFPDRPCGRFQRKERPMYLTFVLSKIRAHQPSPDPSRVHAIERPLAR